MWNFKTPGIPDEKFERAEKVPITKEEETRAIQRRGIWSVKQIRKGEKFTTKNIVVLRSAIGISASDYKKILDKKS